MFQLVALIIPAAIFAAWLVGSVSLSRGSDRLINFAPKALFVFSLTLAATLLVLGETNLMPRWIAGSEGYGVIIPAFSSVAAMVLCLLILVLNKFVVRKLTARNVEKEF